MRKISKAEAGKIGAEKSKITNALKKQQRIAEYMTNPNVCTHCKIVLDYNSRMKKFCSSNCSATYNNLKRKNRKVPITWNCLNCNKKHVTVEWRVGKYCNNKCQKDHITNNRISQWLNEDKSWGLQIPKWAKNWIIDRDGYECSMCNISTWNNSPLILECDHIDGNPKNNKPENLRLLCPNCHSQTESFKGKNYGNGRDTRYLK